MNKKLTALLLSLVLLLSMALPVFADEKEETENSRIRRISIMNVKKE